MQLSSERSSLLLSPFQSRELYNVSFPLVHGILTTRLYRTVIKVLVGRPRPDVIARCLPEAGAENGIPFGLVTSAICTTLDEGRLQEGFRSFPSGHASSKHAS